MTKSTCLTEDCDPEAGNKARAPQRIFTLQRSSYTAGSFVTLGAVFTLFWHWSEWFSYKWCEDIIVNCRVCVCQFKLSCFSLDSADRIWKSNAITRGDTPVQIRTKQPQCRVYKEKGEKDSTGISFLSSYSTRSISLIISINSKYIKLSHGQKCPISTGQKVYKLLKKYIDIGRQAH